MIRQDGQAGRRDTSRLSRDEGKSGPLASLKHADGRTRQIQQVSAARL